MFQEGALPVKGALPVRKGSPAGIRIKKGRSPSFFFSDFICINFRFMEEFWQWYSLHTSFSQLSLMLASYTAIAHLSKLGYYY